MKPQIIVVEDALEVRELLVRRLTRLLKVEVFATDWAEDGVIEALKRPPRLFLTDVNHPGMSVLDEVRTLREKIPPSEMSIWVFSGVVDSHKIPGLKEAGADRFFLKEAKKFPEFLNQVADLLSSSHVD